MEFVLELSSSVSKLYLHRGILAAATSASKDEVDGLMCMKRR
jgi:hypothetical protein